MRSLTTIFIIFVTQIGFSQIICSGSQSFKILHFTKTNGFNQNTRDVSKTMFEEIGKIENFTITDSENATIFDDLNTLKIYEVIIFSNTSGENLLNAQQRQNVEDYIAGGGAFLDDSKSAGAFRSEFL